MNTTAQRLTDLERLVAELQQQLTFGMHIYGAAWDHGFARGQETAAGQRAEVAPVRHLNVVRDGAW